MKVKIKFKNFKDIMDFDRDGNNLTVTYPEVESVEILGEKGTG